MPRYITLAKKYDTTEPGGIMGEWNPRGPYEQYAPAELSLCEMPEPGVAGTPAQRPTEKRPKAPPLVVPPETTPADDPLLGCLMLINRARQRPVPSALMLKGLPLEGQRLTLPLLGAAAAHAGWSTRLVQRNLDEIPDCELPAILLLRGRRPCVLLERRNYGRLLVALPGWGGGAQDVSREELLSEYSHFAILVQPLMQTETQTETQADLEPARPASVAKRPSWRCHWQRLVAATHKVFCLQGRQRGKEAAGVGG
ncbi:hypothetical protein CTP10_R15890 [Cupriavidus sp. P-10]|uniref:peptidase n=1 Tax=Cupriavidus sp. P-10 TaxID=2027911 RepID=UPI001F3C6B82|nr:peptidase [Cupriavidus sp. P-10]BDB24241.1 hypothetical protein CTP10_R15890 [Cupriavidus sp. P-10]